MYGRQNDRPADHRPGDSSMRPRARLNAGFAAILTCAWLAASASRADEPKGLRWVGPDALVYVESTRPTVLIDHAQSERLSRLLHGVPSYKAALGRPELLAARATASVIAAGLGTTWEKGLRDLSGGLVFAVEGTKSLERYFLIVTPRTALFSKRRTRVSSSAFETTPNRRRIRTRSRSLNTGGSRHIA